MYTNALQGSLVFSDEKNDVMTKYNVVTNHEIQNLKLAIAKRHQVKETLEQWMDNKKYQMVLNFDINYNMALLVESDLCYGISIDGVFDTGAYDHLTYRLLEPMIFSQSCLIWKKGLITNQALEKFIECANEIMMCYQKMQLMIIILIDYLTQVLIFYF